MIYEKPTIEIVEADLVLLCGSSPSATDIGAPNVSNEAKSVCDEVNDTYNINKEEDYEVHD